MTDKKSMKEFVIASSMYSLGSIIGPLLSFGGVGFILDRVYGAKPWCLLGSIFLAFITTQVLLFKKIVKINKMIESHRGEDVKDLKEVEDEKIVDSNVVNSDEYK